MTNKIFASLDEAKEFLYSKFGKDVRKERKTPDGVL